MRGRNLSLFAQLFEAILAFSLQPPKSKHPSQSPFDTTTMVHGVRNRDLPEQGLEASLIWYALVFLRSEDSHFTTPSIRSKAKQSNT